MNWLDNETPTFVHQTFIGCTVYLRKCLGSSLDNSSKKPAGFCMDMHVRWSVKNPWVFQDLQGSAGKRLFMTIWRGKFQHIVIRKPTGDLHLKHGRSSRRKWPQTRLYPPAIMRIPAICIYIHICVVWFPVGRWMSRVMPIPMPSSTILDSWSP